MDLKTIIKFLIGVMGCTILYAADWQREQDQRMSGLDALLARQQALLQMQVQLNEMEAHFKRRADAAENKLDKRGEKSDRYTRPD